MEHQRFSRRLRGLPPESQGLTQHRRTRSPSLPRTLNRMQSTHSESPRTLEEVHSPPRDDFDPPIVEDYYSEDKSPRTDSGTETLLDEITNSFNRLSLRNPRARNLIESNMSGDLNNPPAGGTSAAGGNPSSNSGTGSRPNNGATWAAFHTPPGGPFSYGMPPFSGLSHTFGGFGSSTSQNTAGAGSSNPFNNMPQGTNATFNAPLFGSSNSNTGFNPFGNMLSGAFLSHSGNFPGNTSSQFPPFGHSAFRHGFQPNTNTNSCVNFWNTGPNVTSNFLG